MAPTRKVTSIPGVHSFEGKSYGPFEATNKKDFLEVPEAFAFALNLPLHDSEELESEPEQGANIQELLDANESLKTDLDKANSELALLQDIRGGQGNIIQGYITEVADLKQQLADQHTGGNSIIADHQNRVQELEGKLGKAQVEISELNSSYTADKTEWEAERDSLLIDTAAALEREKTGKAELESAQADFIRYQNDLDGLRARVAELEAGAVAEPEGKPAPAPRKASKP